MHALDVLGDPVRRRILELLADGEASAGEIAARIGEEFGISQPAVSQQLKVLREQGFATVRPEGTRRLYAVDPAGPTAAREWLSAFDRFWLPKLAALDTELARGRRQRRLAEQAQSPSPQAAQSPQATQPDRPDPTADSAPPPGSAEPPDPE
ncbi:ArsR/SmtB family transcription factor [Granulicoccus phenolivorans]|uniref:ArsR/SmtB family transcription factor n=1 Tax=Granulicoccus phenolivorans TaxID=266854 RepID=UPI00041BEC6C|nr:metalloregulator ArsR/SmtB family transcription factor [Granulicoccus phenolivorans]